MEEHLKEDSDEVGVGHVLKHLQRVGCLRCDLDEYKHKVEVSCNISLLLELAIPLDHLLTQFGKLLAIALKFWTFYKDLHLWEAIRGISFTFVRLVKHACKIIIFFDGQNLGVDRFLGVIQGLLVVQSLKHFNLFLSPLRHVVHFT